MESFAYDFLDISEILFEPVKPEPQHFYFTNKYGSIRGKFKYPGNSTVHECILRSELKYFDLARERKEYPGLLIVKGIKFLKMDKFPGEFDDTVVDTLPVFLVKLEI
jgi:hypothetical protein